MSSTAFTEHPGDGDRPTTPEGVFALPSTASDFDASLGTRIAWRTAAVLYWVAGLGAAVQLWSGFIAAPVEYPNLTYGISIFAVIFGFAFWTMGELNANPKLLHIGVLLSYTILFLIFANAPSIESMLGVVYIVPLVFVALFLPSRALSFYLALSVALILQAALRHPDSPFGLLPGIMTIIALVSTAGLTLYVRLELTRIERQSAALSGRDALTGLANLRPLYERIERDLLLAERGQSGLTLIMLDLEGFKRVNDEFSHSIGDETLRAVAQAISDTVRRDELVARRGGDEFAIVTAATDEEDLKALIRRISHNVSDARVDLLPEVRSGVTVGYATRIEGDTVGQILARADRALHEAKSRAKIERWSWRQRRLRDAADEIGELD